MAHLNNRTGKRFIPIAASLLLILLAAFPAMASADTLALPAHLNTVGEEAFMGDAYINAVIIPEGCTSIGDRAFAGCSGLLRVTIPESVTFIGEDAFQGCLSVMISGEAGSAAQQYAEEHFIFFAPNAFVVNGIRYAFYRPMEGETAADIVGYDESYTGTITAIPERVTDPATGITYDVGFINPYSFQGSHILADDVVVPAGIACGFQSLCNVSRAKLMEGDGRYRILTYDANSNLTREERHGNENDDVTYYTYDNYGNICQIVGWDAEEQNMIYRRVSQHEGYGRVIFEEMTDYENPDASHKTVFTYHERGGWASIIEYKADGVTMNYRDTFSENGPRIRHEAFCEDGTTLCEIQEWDEEGRETYHAWYDYDENGNVVDSGVDEKTYHNDGTWTYKHTDHGHWGYWIEEHAADGRKTSDTGYDDNDVIIWQALDWDENGHNLVKLQYENGQPVRYETYEHFPDGPYSHEWSYIYNGHNTPENPGILLRETAWDEEGRDTYHAWYEYDENGNVTNSGISERTYFADGSRMERYTNHDGSYRVEAWDSNGQWTQQTNYRSNGSRFWDVVQWNERGWILKENGYDEDDVYFGYEIWSYAENDDSGNPIHKEFRDSHNDLVHNEYLEYDENGNIIWNAYVNPNGIMVHEKTYYGSWDRCASEARYSEINGTLIEKWEWDEEGHEISHVRYD